MVLVTRTGINTDIQNMKKTLDELNMKFDNHVEDDQKFRRKLEIEISRIRETQGEIADRLDILLKEWGEI